MSNLILRAGTVVDGTGAPSRVADVVVDAGAIRAITDPGERAADGAEELDCAGLVVAPGFIDLHTHSDLTRLHYPEAETRALQGVTTEVTGNCGMSPFPVTDDPAEMRSIIGPIDVCPEVEITWRDLDGYLRRLAGTPGATNVAPLIGHGSLRQWASGSSAVSVTDAQLERMRRELERALRAGVWGMSFGLMYAPGELADRRELSLLASEVARFGRLATAHMRSYDAAALLGSVTEVADVVRDSGVRFEISHLRSLHDDDVAGMNAAFGYLDAAGLDIGADAYPYLAGHTTLLQLFPAEVRGLGPRAVLEHLRENPDRAAEELAARVTDGDAITVAKAAVSGYQGLTLAEAGRRMDVHWSRAGVRILLESEGSVDIIVVGSTEADTMRSLADPRVSIASDGVSLALSHSANLPHPRSIGTFPRAIRDLLRHGLPIETAIHKATGKPAKRLGMSDRGTLAAGNAADIVVIDPASIADNATYTNPLIPPSGIHQVIVGGDFVLRDGELTGARPGGLLLAAGSPS
jgi:N-acyl-D-aspartate/D-glutamate deacylase